jgi:hypothetical protein
VITAGLRQIPLRLTMAVVDGSVTSCLREQFEGVENGLPFGFGDPCKETDHAVVARPGQAVVDPGAGIGQTQLHYAAIVRPTLVSMDPASLLKLPDETTDSALRESQPSPEIRLCEPFGITQFGNGVSLRD